ncbi:MAG: DTW domain-containing protein [Bacteriovoracaceae bacterium]|nr:DTW domain-containing protein [Bacteriovoracaceae bacterium]
MRASVCCLCSFITPQKTDICFAILMHPKEARKSKNGTGRLAHLALKNSIIIEGVDFTQNEAVNQLINNDTYVPVVLYPGGSALNVTRGEFGPSNVACRQLLVFVIDGTWPCAKKMMKLSSNINSLKRVCFDPGSTSKFAIKQQPSPLCLSTIEAIYMFLNSFKAKSYDHLLEIQKQVVEFQVKCANDLSLPGYRKSVYKPENQKNPSKKYLKRKIFFDP